MRALLLSALLFSMSCLGEAPPNTDKTTDDSTPTSTDSDPVELCDYYSDADGDGYGDAGSLVPTPCDAPAAGLVEDSTDCDDAEGEVHPGAEETCDGVDNDCEGTVDEAAVDALPWYVDGDGDGYGAPDTEVLACSAPSGHVDNSDDCDDGQLGINPEADETCDGLDNNCDGAVDDDSAVDRFTYYADDDGDNYGDPDASVEGCFPPDEGTWVLDDQDCNDTDSVVNPSQTSFSSTPDSRGSYDRNCDTVEELQYPSRGQCLYSANLNCNHFEGWSTSVPACGASGTRVTSCNSSCAPVLSGTVTQKCL